ncbi:hypothetical protein JHK82_024264 [Glycine max]|uniref:Uncharacterized protein n=2 Tax=Glycine subgen. Soja TaxID=1462606 RepID=K7LCA3_SOYBN|nr:hypothetical protein JHK87_024229 [Glycine soja]KAG5006301.1 hypothetical protein JHK85_024843 [Glycine max]KAG5012095.1 hypothetical protein JHK86_024356 [Glycine max]KAG5133076.1 hypothetical protein JHK82_024264 [Glycine max]KAH1041929.1 hypothetical protein GYH30_024313 [Glycine max]
MSSTVGLLESGYASLTFFCIIHTNKERSSFVASSLLSFTTSFCEAWSFGGLGGMEARGGEGKVAEGEEDLRRRENERERLKITTHLSNF